MQEVRFTICPEDCWVCKVSDRFPDITGEVLSFNQVAGLGRWNSQNRKDLTKAFVYAKRHRYVSALERIHLSETSLVTSAVCQCPLETRIHRLLPRYGYFYLYPKPISFENGEKHYRILVPNDNQFPQFIEEMEKRVGEVNLTYKSPIAKIEPEISTAAARGILSKLTPRQKEALQVAYRSQYYDSPRKTTMQKMGSQMAIGKSTFQTHLRKAESKILESIMDHAH